MTSLQFAILLELIQHVAHGCLAIRISGEIGVGKKLFAHLLYHRYKGQQPGFIALNFAQYRHNSSADKIGRYAKQARKRLNHLLSGTVPAVYYLEAIDHMPRDMQDQLSEIITSAEAIPQRSWYLASSIEPLEHQSAQGRFSETLLAAMDMAHISFAPLRARPEAIPHLLAALLRQDSSLDVLPAVGMPDAQTMDSLMRYSWPGNLRQLRQLANRALTLGHWPPKINDWPSRPEDVTGDEIPGLDLDDLMPLTELHIQKNNALKLLLSGENPNNTGLLDLALYDEALSQICD